MPDADALKRQLDSGDDVLVLDVRGANEFNDPGGHITGTQNLPLEEPPNRLAELEDRKQRAIRIICRTDRRSKQAAQELADAGFGDALPVSGGMTAWHAKGWPIKRSCNRSPKQQNNETEGNNESSAVPTFSR